jgi:hypothetical protein
MYFGIVKVGLAMMIFSVIQGYEYREELKELIKVYFIKLRNYINYNINKLKNKIWRR